MAFFRGTGGADTATFQQLPLAIDEGGTNSTTTASARASLLPAYAGANFVLTVNADGADVSFATAAGASGVSFDATTANFTGVLQNGGSNVVVDSDIGSNVQAYDADTAKLDAATANFTGILQDGGNTVLTTASTIEGGTY